MKIDVPFLRSKKDTDCGPLALRMILEYFGESHSFDEISNKERQLSSGLVWSLGILRAAKKFGFEAKLISKSNFSHDDSDLDYYKKYSNNEGMLLLKELADEYEIEEMDLSFDELLGFVSKNSIPIVLINWFIISGDEGYSGHFVPVVGYDDDFVYIHNPGLKDAMAYMPIKRELFLKAWESKGTDKDCIVIFRKE